jgi:hypothetical protein
VALHQIHNSHRLGLEVVRNQLCGETETKFVTGKSTMMSWTGHRLPAIPLCPIVRHPVTLSGGSYACFQGHHGLIELGDTPRDAVGNFKKYTWVGLRNVYLRKWQRKCSFEHLKNHKYYDPSFNLKLMFPCNKKHDQLSEIV